MTGDGEAAAARLGSSRSDGSPAMAESTRSDADQSGPGRKTKTKAALSELTRARLSVQLRAMYDTVAQQPVPDRFANLISRLDAADHEKA